MSLRERVFGKNPIPPGVKARCPLKVLPLFFPFLSLRIVTFEYSRSADRLSSSRIQNPAVQSP